MISLNQFVVTWENLKSQLLIQSKKGVKGPYTELNDQNATLYGFIEKDSSESVPYIKYSADNTNQFYSILLREEASYYITIRLQGSLMSSHIKKFSFVDNYIEKYINLYPENYWREIEVEGVTFVEIFGEINSKNFVGLLNLSLGEKEPFFCEVAAKKINYVEDYKNFLNEIAEESSNLLMQFGGGSYLKYESNNDISNDFNKLIHLRNIIKDIPLAMETVLRRFHNKLESMSNYEPVGSVRRPNIRETLTQPYNLKLEYGGILKDIFNGYTPQRLIETTKLETIDTAENRYIKNFLEELHLYCFNLKGFLQQSIDKDNKKKIYSVYISEVKDWISIIENYLYQPIFRQINRMEIFPSSSQVLQNRAGYQDILLMDLKLNAGLKLSWNAIEAVTNDAYVRPVYELYEIWCFFKMRNALREIFGPEQKKERNIWSDVKGNINFDLKKGNTSCAIFENKEIKVLFYYNKEFSQESKLGKSYSLKYKPDYTLYIINPTNEEEGYFVHFDAKYRIETFNNIESKKQSSNKQDIVKMHAYKDGIIKSLGSYVLYPGNEYKIFKESSNIIPSVGAIPLSPNNKSDENRLKYFINEIIDYVKAVLL